MLQSLILRLSRISLNMKNSTVKEVLKKIENCSEFTFFYNDEIIDVDKRVIEC